MTTPPGIIPGGVSAAAFGELLLQAMSASKAAALLLDPTSDIAVADWLQGGLLPSLADRDFALVVKDQADVAEKIKADALHLSDMTQVKKLRSRFADISIGASCLPERHEAMIAAELGADYVAFETAAQSIDDLLPLVEWWAEMMTVPNVVFAKTPETAALLAKAGADFIAISSDVWQEPDPLKAIIAIATAIT